MWGTFIPHSMPVYPGAFHRSVLEELLHTAPTLGNLREAFDTGMDAVFWL